MARVTKDLVVVQVLLAGSLTTSLIPTLYTLDLKSISFLS